MSAELRTRFFSLSDAELIALRDKMDAYLGKFLDVSAPIREDNESGFIDRIPPDGDYLVDEPTNPDIASVIIEQIPQVPSRWRPDVLFGVVQLLGEQVSRRQLWWRRLLNVIRSVRAQD